MIRILVSNAEVIKQLLIAQTSLFLLFHEKIYCTQVPCFSSILCNSIIRRRPLKIQDMTVQAGTFFSSLWNITYRLIMSPAKLNINNFQFVINKKGTFHFDLRFVKKWRKIKFKMWLNIVIRNPIYIVPFRQTFFLPFKSPYTKKMNSVYFDLLKL